MGSCMPTSSQLWSLDVSDVPITLGRVPASEHDTHTFWSVGVNRDLGTCELQRLSGRYASYGTSYVKLYDNCWHNRPIDPYFESHFSHIRERNPHFPPSVVRTALISMLFNSHSSVAINRGSLQPMKREVLLPHLTGHRQSRGTMPACVGT